MERTNAPAQTIESWSTRIAAAIERQESRSLAALVKPAALVAAGAGHLDLVKGWLGHVHPSVIERDPQLLYWSGATRLLKRPAAAQPFFVRAFELLTARPKGFWIMLAWAGVVDSIFLHYRDLRELDRWIEWMTPDREAIVGAMPRAPRSLVVASMLFALGFRQPNHPQMAAWRERAERLAELDSVSDFGIRLTTGLMSGHIWRGNLAAAEVIQTRFRVRTSRAQLSPIATVLACVNEATLHLHQGRLRECLSAVEHGVAASALHDIRLWEGILRCHAAAAHCSLGEITDAKRHVAAVEQLFAEGIPVDEAYYRAMLFWVAFLAGDHVGAVSRCEEALTFVESKGVPYLQAVCRLGSALALFEAGHRERAFAMLEDGLRIGRDIANPMLGWIGGLFRSHVLEASGEHAAADKALEDAMRLGRDHSLAHFFFWPRNIVIRLIDRALERGYSPDYARFLIDTHSLAPGALPTRSDQWAFDVRIHTFGDPRIEHADGRIEPLSAQFQRQIELLTALIAREGRPTPFHVLAGDIYQDADIEAIGSTKRVLHSLRARIGPVIVQRNASLSIDFTKVWIDACSFQRLCREARDATEVVAWLDRYYQGDFMDRVENSEIVLGTRHRLHDQVVRILRDTRRIQIQEEGRDAARLFEARWKTFFPSL
jgi:hypothetical protein